MPYPDEFEALITSEFGKYTDSKKQITQELAAYTVQDTYGAAYPKEADHNETISQGGYASHIRAHGHFVFFIPDEISSRFAEPMLCAGLTVWRPLVRAGVGKGQQGGIVGLGGLSHFAVLRASALGAEVTVVSHSPHKKDDALKLETKRFVCSGEEGWAKPLAFKFDLLFNTVDMANEFNLAEYLSRLSHIDNRPEYLWMFKFAAKNELFTMVETLPVGEKGCAEAVERVNNNKVRCRFKLVDYAKVFDA
ncbi:hypothetical protein DL768_003329 [Monosporascus sp. mg162]|nr:hypothetical protein DL768_003329 [Monosporascus sp. mg162]